MHVVKGDTVRVMRGDDKGKEGKMLRVTSEDGPGRGRRRQHREAAPQGPHAPRSRAGSSRFPAPIHASNVMLLDPKTARPTRVRARIDEDGTKERVSAKSGDAIPRASRRKR